MRVNNPQSMLGFVRGENNETVAYNLATIGQVQAALEDLKSKIDNYFWGTEGFGKTPGGHGYAWLNSQGVVDTKLLPQLAITQTHTVPQAELKALGVISAENRGEADSQFKTILNTWLKSKVEENVEGKTYQEGDVIVVTVAAGEKPDPIFAGSYIITAVPSNYTTDPFTISKLAYNDGNVVSVNDQVADNVGNLTLSLYDIIKTRYIRENGTDGAEGLANAITAAEKLTDTVYRLRTVEDDSYGYRFAFINDHDTKGDGLPVPLTRFDEFNTEKAATSARFDDVNATIQRLADRHDAELSALTKKHNEETAFISGTIGTTADEGNREGTIFARTKQLRDDVDLNTANLAGTAALTNSMLALVQKNAKNLHQGLNKRAVRMYLQSFTWDASNGELVEFALDNANERFFASASTVSGVVNWTYTHSPIGTSNVTPTYNSNGTSVTEADLTGINANTYKQGLLNSANSEERILAIYDDNFNLVNADLKLVYNQNTGLYDSVIGVSIDYVGREENGTITGSLAGKTWTMLIAKTIDGIEIDENLVSVYHSSGN